MKIERFEDIVAWQKAKELTILVYQLFKGNRDYGFGDQIQRASISIMNNIAEGFERHTDKELRCSLYIAKGSCGEVRSMLYIARELGYMNEADFNHLFQLSVDASKLLSGFIRRL